MSREKGHNKVSNYFKGVTPCPQKKGIRFRVQITTAKEGTVYLGTYPDPVSAALVYDRATIERHGKDAVTNRSLGLFKAYSLEG